MLHKLKAMDVLTQEYRKIGQNKRLSHALSLFDEDTTVLIVADEKNRYAGIITERMILRSGLDPEKTKVRTLKTHAPKISPETPLTECARLMIENDLTCLPVFERQELKGVVTDRAILRAAMESELAKRKIREFMTEAPIVVSPEDSIARVLRTFREFHISRLPVVENGKLVGIITLHDVIAKVVMPKERPSFGTLIDEKESLTDLPVENVMSFNLVTCGQDASVREAIRLMLENDVSSVIVSEDSETLRGIVTKKDLLEPISEQKPRIAYPLVQISSKVRGVDRNRIANTVRSFIKKYGERLGETTCYIYITKHKEKHRGRHLYYARIRLTSPYGRFAAAAEGWGEDLAVRHALFKIEKQMHAREELETPRQRREFLEYVEIESLT